MNISEIAKNIKAELLAAYPGEKFSVRKGGGSTSYAVDVEYRDGINTGKVYEIANAYADKYDIYVTPQRNYWAA